MMYLILVMHGRSVSQKAGLTNLFGVSGRLPLCGFLFRSPFNKDLLLILTVIHGSERFKVFPVNVIESGLGLLEGHNG
jgi:hypothetical protein